MAQESHAELALRKPCDLIRFEIRGAGIEFPTTQRFARRAREFFITPAKLLQVCFFKAFREAHRKRRRWNWRV